MEKLDSIFDIAPTEPLTLAVAPVVLPPASDNEEDDDFIAARANTYEIIEQCKAAANSAMVIAAETQHPRALEVLGNILKISSEVNKTLINLSKDRAEAKAAKNGKQPIQQIGTQNNTQFVGSSSDLNTMLAERIAASRDSNG